MWPHHQVVGSNIKRRRGERCASEEENTKIFSHRNGRQRDICYRVALPPCEPFQDIWCGWRWNEWCSPHQTKLILRKEHRSPLPIWFLPPSQRSKPTLLHVINYKQDRCMTWQRWLDRPIVLHIVFSTLSSVYYCISEGGERGGVICMQACRKDKIMISLTFKQV